MYDRGTIDLALLALEEEMTQVEAAELCGASRGAVQRWGRGLLPRAPWRASGSAARPLRRPARMAPPDAEEDPLDGDGEGGLRGRYEREYAAQGGVERPKRGRFAPGFDIEQEKVRAGREIARGDSKDRVPNVGVTVASPDA